jgi:predicted solute-binding protein
MYGHSVSVPPNVSVGRRNSVILWENRHHDPVSGESRPRGRITMPGNTQHHTTRIAAVQYLNTVTLIEGLETWEGCELVKAVPSKIAPMLTQGDTDIGLASIVDALDPANDLALIPSGMIGCDGPTLTVRLFSSVPIERITRVHADTDSHTSIMLADLLLHELHGISADFVEFDARERMSIAQDRSIDPDEAWPETLLIIGDKVVVDRPRRSGTRTRSTLARPGTR